MKNYTISLLMVALLGAGSIYANQNAARAEGQVAEPGAAFVDEEEEEASMAEIARIVAEENDLLEKEQADQKGLSAAQAEAILKNQQAIMKVLGQRCQGPQCQVQCNKGVCGIRQGKKLAPKNGIVIVKFNNPKCKGGVCVKQYQCQGNKCTVVPNQTKGK